MFMWVEVYVGQKSLFSKENQQTGEAHNLLLPIFDDDMAEQMFMWVENTIMFMWVRTKTQGRSADPTGAIKL